MKELQTFIRQIFQDKNSSYSLREVIVMLLVLVVIISWIAQQFYGKDIPQYMFYAFISLIGAGCFGYSLEDKSKQLFNNEKQITPNEPN
jgi:hypothetical protein